VAAFLTLHLLDTFPSWLGASEDKLPRRSGFFNQPNAKGPALIGSTISKQVAERRCFDSELMMLCPIVLDPVGCVDIEHAESYEGDHDIDGAYNFQLLRPLRGSPPYCTAIVDCDGIHPVDGHGNGRTFSGPKPLPRT
jgi:hypothetical protein